MLSFLDIFKKRKKQNGFTLIEVLVAITIIGILSTTILAYVNRAKQKARDTIRLSNLHQVAAATEMYYDSNGGYPTARDWSSVNFGVFFPNKPNDPIDAIPYVYTWQDNTSDNKKFVMCANKENCSLGNCIIYIREAGDIKDGADICPAL